MKRNCSRCGLSIGLSCGWSFHGISGDEKYLPWSYWNDGRWRCMEPDGDLPFWKPHRSGRPERYTGGGLRLMVHEGPKAAEAADRLARPITIEERKLASAHPWADELAGFEHWGLLGGVHAVERADFAELRESGVREIVYFCDNDEPGLLVPKPFSRRWGQKFRVIKLDRRWPPGWDIADPMPSQLFDDSVPTEERPSLRGLMRPATWATKTGWWHPEKRSSRT